MKKLEDLPPNLWLNDIKLWKDRLETIINEKEKKVKTNIEKKEKLKIHISSCKGTAQYTLIKDRRKKYISKAEIKKIKAIAQTEYDEKILEELQNEFFVLQKFIKIYEARNVSIIYSKMSKHRRKLITPLTLMDAEYINIWNKIEYERKPLSDSIPEYLTENNEYVRSKSEVIIANTLLHHNIPYRYEFPVQLQNYIAHPDFCCLNVRTRTEYLWEHLGLLDNAEYSSTYAQKIIEYEKSGYFPGHNLILTFETTNMPLSISQINAVIKEYLI